jgi:hypothetical protein
MRTLDGTEVAHASVLGDKYERAERPTPTAEEAQLRAFFEQARSVNPDIAPIGASDFHWGGPVGVCRTYVEVAHPSQAGILEGVRRGRTVAVCPGGRVTGAPDLIARAAAQLSTEPAATFGYALSTWIALAGLTALAVAVLAR